jgi:hypothetical protein
MKTFQFIHPLTAEVFNVEGDKVLNDEGYFIVKHKNRNVAIFKNDYSFVLAE